MSAVKSALTMDDIVLHLAHYLPAQLPLKDFVHHNTLHAFQDLPFNVACTKSEILFGYKTRLPIEEYRNRYKKGEIPDAILNQVIGRHYAENQTEDWRHLMLFSSLSSERESRIGQLRDNQKALQQINLDKEVHPILFRIIAAYLDQGIAIWQIPVHDSGFLESVRELERNSSTSFFRNPRVRDLFRTKRISPEQLLEWIVGEPSWYEHYLFDQQFAHPGWSGMVSILETNPGALLDPRPVSLSEFIHLELWLELDALETQLNGNWKPLAELIDQPPIELFAPFTPTESDLVLSFWQEAFEWSYFDQVLSGLTALSAKKVVETPPSFQAIFCIDDRECSLRRHLEKHDKDCQTFGTPGFFNIEFYFQPAHSHHYTKVCPVPIQPRHLIKELSPGKRVTGDRLETSHSQGILGGWLISQTLGFLAGLRLIIHLFMPRESKIMVSSDQHMNSESTLTIEREHGATQVDGLQVGFTKNEMADRVEKLLRSIGLRNEFATIVYIIGHGASSSNNTYYAGYDCGACSGRAGSVNARVFAQMANEPEVRTILEARGISIPDSTRFIGGLHDTTRDTCRFYDESKLNSDHAQLHKANARLFQLALDDNARERSRRFILVNSKRDAKKVHRAVARRAVSLFEPRPELNHASNALCIIGQRSFSKHLFLDRRSFLNSYHYLDDPDGRILEGILSAITPVCGGINLEYYFSRMDNHRLGAGSKLPHNVVGLIGLANGTDGDLRHGLPEQMIEMHTPVRLLVVVEQDPQVVQKTVMNSSQISEWYINEWIHLVAIHPETREVKRFRNGEFEVYPVHTASLNEISLADIPLSFSEEDIPVSLIA